MSDEETFSHLVEIKKYLKSKCEWTQSAQVCNGSWSFLFLRPDDPPDVGGASRLPPWKLIFWWNNSIKKISPPVGNSAQPEQESLLTFIPRENRTSLWIHSVCLKWRQMNKSRNVQEPEGNLLLKMKINYKKRLLFEVIGVFSNYFIFYSIYLVLFNFSVFL